jgi:uncharacterized protein YjbI with pentapeptide repeats
MNEIKVLFLAANPAETSRLKLDEEIRAVTIKIRASEHRDLLNLVSAWAVRPADLLQVLNEHKPQIVHFSGHGKPTGEIILVDENRKPKPVSTTAIKELFRTLKDNIRVVVLNACYSRAQAEAIKEIIDCAIGMSATIGDQAAITFAASFYGAIGFGRSVQESFEQGKVALLLEGIPDDDIPELLCKLGVDPSEVFLLEIHDERVDSYKSNGQQSQIDEYINYMSNLFLGESGTALKKLARARTFDICPNLDAKGKARVLKFIYEIGLIDREDPIIDLLGIDLSGADLAGANLVGANLTQSDLSGAILSNTNLERSSLVQANLTRAILCGADLTRADMRQANLSNADLTQANLWNTNLQDANLSNAKLEGANLEESIEVAGQVMAGTGDVKEYRTELDELEEGKIYRFEVVGDSMEHENIREGDYVIVRASSKWPSEGDTIVTKYLPSEDVIVIGSMADIDDSRIAGPTVKVFHEKRADNIYLLGWKKSIKGHQPITAKHIWPMGKVVTICPTLDKKPKRKWEWLGVRPREDWQGE